MILVEPGVAQRWGGSVCGGRGEEDSHREAWPCLAESSVQGDEQRGGRGCGEWVKRYGAVHREGDECDGGGGSGSDRSDAGGGSGGEWVVGCAMGVTGCAMDVGSPTAAAPASWGDCFRWLPFAYYGLGRFLPSSSLCVRCLAAAALGEGPLDVGEAPGLAAPASDPRLAALASLPTVSGGRSSSRQAGSAMPRRHATPRPTSDPTTRFLPRRPPAAHAKSKSGISTRTHSTHSTHTRGRPGSPSLHCVLRLAPSQFTARTLTESIAGEPRSRCSTVSRLQQSHTNTAVS